jgi:hypothetical protein
VRLDQWQDLDRIVQMQQMIERMMDQMSADMSSTFELGSDPLAAKDPTDMENFWLQDDTFTRFMDGVKAELERLGLSGLLGRFGESGEPDLAGLFGETARSADPMQTILDQLTSSSFADLMDGELASALGGVSVEMAREALSVPGLEAFQGPDVMSMNPADINALSSASPVGTYHYDGKTGVSVVETSNGNRYVDVPLGYSKETSDNVTWWNGEVGRVVEVRDTNDQQVLIVFLPEPGNTERNEVTLSVWNEDLEAYELVRVTMDPETGETEESPPSQGPKQYESPDGPVMWREPISFSPQDTLNQLQQPGEETTVDHSMLIDRFVRGVVARLMSTINPAPEGGTPGGVDGGDTSPGPLTNPLGGDPGDDTPTPFVTRDNGPKPIGDPDSPTGPGGPVLPGQGN